jgi:hypothetical protein
MRKMVLASALILWSAQAYAGGPNCMAERDAWDMAGAQSVYVQRTMGERIVRGETFAQAKADWVASNQMGMQARSAWLRCMNGK